MQPRKAIIEGSSYGETIYTYIHIVGDEHAIVRQFVPPFARIFAIQPTVLDILRSRRMAGSDKGVEEGRAVAFARRKMKFSATKRPSVVCVDRNFPRETTGVEPLCAVTFIQLWLITRKGSSATISINRRVEDGNAEKERGVEN